MTVEQVELRGGNVRWVKLQNTIHFICKIVRAHIMNAIFDPAGNRDVESFFAVSCEMPEK